MFILLAEWYVLPEQCIICRTAYFICTTIGLGRLSWIVDWFSTCNERSCTVVCDLYMLTGDIGDDQNCSDHYCSYRAFYYHDNHRHELRQTCFNIICIALDCNHVCYDNHYKIIGIKNKAKMMLISKKHVNQVTCQAGICLEMCCVSGALFLGSADLENLSHRPVVNNKFLCSQKFRQYVLDFQYFYSGHCSSVVLVG